MTPIVDGRVGTMTWSATWMAASMTPDSPGGQSMMIHSLLVVLVRLIERAFAVTTSKARGVPASSAC
ncbi:hypothetical protein [Corynebacterium diphtheriae]|uniref:hypothetical protein n=1 Tax=Corynebacterium diphtheriae TaxID=1717 RepID=UPI003531FD02